MVQVRKLWTLTYHHGADPCDGWVSYTSEANLRTVTNYMPAKLFHFFSHGFCL
jgi:hypothetical protein